MVFNKFQIAGNRHQGVQIMATSPGKTMYTKSTNMLPLDYQVIPGLQLSALNFELSWKIVT